MISLPRYASALSFVLPFLASACTAETGGSEADQVPTVVVATGTSQTNTCRDLEQTFSAENRSLRDIFGACGGLGGGGASGGESGGGQQGVPQPGPQFTACFDACTTDQSQCSTACLRTPNATVVKNLRGGYVPVLISGGGNKTVGASAAVCQAGCVTDEVECVQACAQATASTVR